ncbi:MAG: zinc ribbon domain-containing protein [Lachnospiraceae bacterium]
MFCPTCGKELPEGASFCSSCGASLSNYSTQNLQGQGSASPTTGSQEQMPYTSPQAGSQVQPSYATPQNSSYRNTYQSYGQQGYYQQPYGQPMPGYSFNSDSTLFQNPHTGLLAFVIVLGFLTAIFCNCGLIQYHPDLTYYNSDLELLRFFPMCLIAFSFIYSLASGQADDIISYYRYTNIDMEQILSALASFFVLMTALALLSFIFSCIIAGKASLRRRHPAKQLRTMNTFLIINWIFWLFYTILILLPMVLLYKQTKEVVFMIQYTVFGYLYIGCLILMTILKCVYSKKIMTAYSAYERSMNGYQR